MHLCVHMYACVLCYVPVYACMCAQVRMCICVHVGTCHMHACVHVCAHMCFVHVCAYVCVNVHVHMCICVNVYVCMCVCVFNGLFGAGSKGHSGICLGSSPPRGPKGFSAAGVSLVSVLGFGDQLPGFSLGSGTACCPPGLWHCLPRGGWASPRGPPVMPPVRVSPWLSEVLCRS